MNAGVVAAILLALGAALSPAAADATGVKITVNGSGRFHGGHGSDHRHRRPAVVVVPVPVYVTSPRRCVVPGYWAYAWVPQTYLGHVWVPGHWSPDARWVEGYYEPRTWAWGYYQPYWVPERWTPC
jgi:hypothetical protein